MRTNLNKKMGTSVPIFVLNLNYSISTNSLCFIPITASGDKTKQAKTGQQKRTFSWLWNWTYSNTN